MSTSPEPKADFTLILPNENSVSKLLLFSKYKNYKK